MPSLKQMTPRWVKTTARQLAWHYRQATWRSRPLPDFIIIGAQKSGTSSLYACLGQHPELVPSYRKEVHFFDGGLDPTVDTFARGPEWYRSHFPSRSNVSAHAKTFEASPLYIFNPLAARRLFDLIPEVKIIAVLRNPTERAISHYFHSIRNGDEQLPLNEALKQEEQRLQSVIANADYKNRTFIGQSYKSRGMYKQQLERYLNHFPWQQILVLSSEEFFSEPDTTLRRVFEFVGVDAGFKVKHLTPRNVTPNRSKVDQDVYAYLNSYFLPHNKALYELLGKSYDW